MIAVTFVILSDRAPEECKRFVPAVPSIGDRAQLVGRLCEVERRTFRPAGALDTQDGLMAVDLFVREISHGGS